VPVAELAGGTRGEFRWPVAFGSAGEFAAPLWSPAMSARVNALSRRGLRSGSFPARYELPVENPTASIVESLSTACLLFLFRSSSNVQVHCAYGRWRTEPAPHIA
jgi:hypothetical protein